MHKRLGFIIGILLFLALSAASQAADLKPRIIVLTDIAPNTVEPDVICEVTDGGTPSLTSNRRIIFEPR